MNGIDRLFECLWARPPLARSVIAAGAWSAIYVFREECAMSEVESVPRFTLSPILTDIVAWIAATDIAALARFDFAPHKVPWASVSVLALFLAGGQLLVGGLVLMYGGRYVPGSFDEMRGVAVSATALCFLATAIVAPLHPD